MEFGAGLGYADSSRGLDMTLRVHGLAGHAEDDYDEWGVSGSLRLAPGVSGRGLMMSLTPSYSADLGGSERLWMLQNASGLAANDDAPLSSRFDAELGHGFAAPLLSGTVTPYTGLGLSSENEHTFRLGARWEVMSDAALSLEGARRESAASEADHGVMLRGAMQW